MDRIRTGNISIHNSRFCIYFYAFWCIVTIVLPFVFGIIFYSLFVDHSAFILALIPIYAFIQIRITLRLRGRLYSATITDEGVCSTICGLRRLTITWDKIKYCGVFIHCSELYSKDVYLLLSETEISADSRPPRHYRYGNEVAVKLPESCAGRVVDIINSKLSLSIDDDLFEKLSKTFYSICLNIYSVNHGIQSTNTDSVGKDFSRYKENGIVVSNSGAKWHNRCYNTYFAYTMLLPAISLVWGSTVGLPKLGSMLTILALCMCLIMQVIMLLIYGRYLHKTRITSKGVASFIGRIRVRHFNWEQIQYIGIYLLPSHQESRLMITSTYLLLSTEEISPKKHPISLNTKASQILIRLSTFNAKRVVEILNSNLGISLNQEELLLHSARGFSAEYSEEIRNAKPLTIIKVNQN